MYLKEYSKLTIDRIKALNEIRSITRHIIKIQSEGCSEEELKNAQRELNNSYDTFVDKYGRITSRANDRAFRDDADYPLRLKMWMKMVMLLRLICFINRLSNRN